MIKKFACWILLAGTSLLVAQVPRYDYFSPELCRANGVKEIMVYEVQVDDSAKAPKKASTIRLATNLLRQSFYNREGLCIRSLRFKDEGKTLVTEILRSYDAQQRVVEEIYRQYNTNYADSTYPMLTRRITYHYGANGLKQSAATAMINGDKAHQVDSVTYSYDASMRLLSEETFNTEAVPLKRSYVWTHRYEGSKITRGMQLDGLEYNRDEFQLDGQGRIARESNFQAGQALPNLETNFIYKGKLLMELQYSLDWDLFRKSEQTTHRRNQYDAKGQLTEALYDYGDGKRVTEFYDYSYWGKD